MSGGERAGASLAVFYFFNPSMFRATLDIAAAMRALRGYDCLLFCPVYLPQTERYREECDAAGLMFVSGMTSSFEDNRVIEDLRARYPGRVGEATADAYAEALDSFTIPDPESLASAESLQLFASGRGTTLGEDARVEFESGPVERVAYWCNLYFHLLREAGAVLKALDARLVVCAEENVDYNSAVFIEAMHDMGRPAACFSSALPTAKEAAAYFFGREPHHLDEGAFAAFFREAFPLWVYEFEGRSMTRFPVERAIAMELCGLAPRRPWIINTGASEILSVESDFAKELFADLGAETVPGRVRALGHPALDELHAQTLRRETVRAGIRETFGLDARLPIALFSPPTDQFATTPAPGYRSYDELLDHWVDSMARLGSFESVVTAHPMMTAAHLERMRSRGARVIEEPASRLLPACDLFIASVSTTIKWARAIGKPVVNYDCYHMKYDAADRKSYLEGFDHIYSVRHEADYLALLDRFDREGASGPAIRAAKSGTRYWGRVDGLALERITGAFDALVKRARRKGRGC